MVAGRSADTFDMRCNGRARRTSARQRRIGVIVPRHGDVDQARRDPPQVRIR